MGRHPEASGSSQANPELRAALELIGSGLFSHGDRELFRPLLNNLLGQDDYLAAAFILLFCKKVTQCASYVTFRALLI